MGTQRTNSPMDDPLPAAIPQPQPMDKLPQSQWATLGKSKKYPEIQKYLEGRIEFYRQYLPNGTPISGLTNEQRAEGWDNAVIIIGELEGLRKRIAGEVAASKVQ